MANNASLWTLNFEMFYYLAFLAAWRLAPRAGPLFAALAVATAAAVVLPGFPAVVSCYASGSLYWFAGLSIAWLAPKNAGCGNWPSALLVTAVMWPLAPFWAFSSAWHIPDLPILSLSLRRLDNLPVCLWLLLAVTGRARAWHRPLTVLCLAVASLGLIVRFRTGDFGDLGRAPFVAYAAATGLAWALVSWKPEPRALAALAPVGLVSFGLYAVSLALQFGILGQPLLPRGTPWSYCLRFALLVALSFATAWMLERRLQPAIRAWFRGRRAGGQPQTA
jgi:peptidoglycan/LPS O-acetylase OafA/YrhL